MAGGVDEVDEERRQTFFTGLLDQGEILLWQGVIQRDGTATYTHTVKCICEHKEDIAANTKTHNEIVLKISIIKFFQIPKIWKHLVIYFVQLFARRKINFVYFNILNRSCNVPQYLQLISVLRNKMLGLVTHVDLIVMHRSCSSLRVSVKRVSPALAPAMIPALLTRESVRVDLP